VPGALQGPCQFAESPENRASVRADHIYRTKITPTVGAIWYFSRNAIHRSFATHQQSFIVNQISSDKIAP
jgi:hypothetical protein